MIRPVVRQPRSERITQVRRRGGAVPSEVAMASGFLIVFMRALVTVPVLAGELSCAAHCVAARYVARRDGSPTDVRNARSEERRVGKEAEGQAGAEDGRRRARR